ncbi:MAG: rane protein of unknown function [Klenkia sp.]|nr:rane protein of unknown function [Klenkia sp.]
MTRVADTGSGLTTWPRLRETWWIGLLAVLALALFVVGLLVRVRCGTVGCPPRDRWFDLDAVGGLPRLFTTALFVVTGVLAGVAARRTDRFARVFWVVVAGVGALLAVAKLTSVHSVAKSDDGGTTTLLVGFGVTVLGLAVVALAGHRGGVVGTRAVVVAMAFYAVAALGLDVVTGVVSAAQSQTGVFSVAGATFVEEFGEAVTALVLLVTVRWHVPAGR